MGLISTVTRQPITDRADELVNTILKNNWTITDPPVEDIDWGKFWELSDKNNVITAWEQPVDISLVGVQGKNYDHAIPIQIEITTKNPEEIAYPPLLAKMVFRVQDIITDKILAGVRPAGYYSMELIGRQYVRNTEITDKQTAIVFVKINVRCVHT